MSAVQLCIKSNALRESPICTTVFGSSHSPNVNNEMKTLKSPFWVFIAGPGKVPVAYAL